MNQKMWNELASEEQLNNAVSALEDKGFGVIVAETAKEASEKILGMIPKGSVVMDNSSVTLETLGIKEAIESGDYISARKAIWAVNDKAERDAARKKYSIVDYGLGSANAITEQGELIIASNTGSQIPTYAFNAEKVIFAIGTHKIVRDIAEGLERIEKYVVPLEDEHMLKLYGMHTAQNKILVIRGENIPGRITVVLIKESVGF